MKEKCKHLLKKVLILTKQQTYTVVLQSWTWVTHVVDTNQQPSSKKLHCYVDGKKFLFPSPPPTPPPPHPRFFALFIQKHTKAPNICFRQEKSIKNADLNIPCCIEINDHVSLFPQIPGRSSFMGASRLKRTPLKSFQCTKLMATKHNNYFGIVLSETVVG